VPADWLRPTLRLVGRAQRPGAAEVDANRRARSAVMRVAEKLPADTGAPVGTTVATAVAAGVATAATGAM